MASKRLGKPITIEHSLEVARSKNYTYQGEMFSGMSLYVSHYEYDGWIQGIQEGGKVGMVIVGSR